jgi:hypothetical protein
MNMPDENKRYILNEHLKNISHISDKEYQQRVWNRGEGPEVDDFDETVCHFFDDGDPILEKYKDYGITDDQCHLLIKFRAAFDTFVYGPRPYLSEEFVNTPEWTKVITSLQSRELECL